jgi:nitroreductase
MKRLFLIQFIAFFTILSASAQDIILPQPIKTGGMPLMDALSKRSSCREFSNEEIDNQVLSNLLWAAWGYNREDKRTAPSSMNFQEIDLYVVKKSGAYIYDARNNILKQISNLDLRMETAKQEYVADAPLDIVFVSDTTKGGDASATNCGFISQNIYLYCASEGLGTVVRGYFDAKTISKALNLKETQVPILTQTIGKKKVPDKQL